MPTLASALRNEPTRCSGERPTSERCFAGQAIATGLPALAGSACCASSRACSRPFRCHAARPGSHAILAATPYPGDDERGSPQARMAASLANRHRQDGLARALR